MKETISLSNDKSLMSEVELNQNLICVGDKLFAQGGDTYFVTELFEGGFAAKCEWEENDFFFDELQKGWSISESTKNNNETYNKVRYE
tara:strand:- start:851 stop:1114 length:264 start_codon:yes stop_codon:yes gene_type:complete